MASADVCQHAARTWYTRSTGSRNDSFSGKPPSDEPGHRPGPRASSGQSGQEWSHPRPGALRVHGPGTTHGAAWRARLRLHGG
jgi:hypothetical protein